MSDMKVVQRDLADETGINRFLSSGSVHEGDAKVCCYEFQNDVHAADLCDASKLREAEVHCLQIFFKDVSGAGAGFANQQTFAKQIFD